MAAHRRPNFPTTGGSHSSHSSLDASSLRIEDDSPPRQQTHTNDAAPQSDDEEVFDPLTGRTYLNQFTEDGVRLYRPSAEEARQIGHDPRGGPPPPNILFADDVPWLPPELRTAPPPFDMDQPHRRGRSRTRKEFIDDFGEVDDYSGSEGNSQESLQDHLPPEYRGLVGPSHSQPYLPEPWQQPPSPDLNQPSTNAEYNRQHYPAYDNAARRIGMEHVRNPTGSRQGDGSYYRERTQHYPTGNHFPQVMAVELQHSGTTRPRRSKEKHNDENPLNATPGEEPELGAATQGQGEQSGTEDVPDASPYLRDLLGLPPDVPINLDCLQDPPPGEKPNYPYPTLVQLAIYGSPNKRLTLSEIYTTLEDRYEWFRNTPEKSKWQGSIRHNLSLNKVFRQIPRPISQPGKGNWWIVDYSEGGGNKRQRKRNRKPTKSERRAAAQEESDDDSDPEYQASKSYPAGYVTTFRSVPAPAGRAPPGLGAHTGPAINPMFIVKNAPLPRVSAGTTSRSAASQSNNPNPTPPPPPVPFDDANIDPLLRDQGHVVGERRSRYSPHMTASPYGPPQPLRRSARLRNQDCHSGSRSPSVTPDEPQTSQSRAVFGQVSFGAQPPSNPNWTPYGSSAPAPNNALGLGLGSSSTSPSEPSPSSNSSPASGAPPVRRSAREAAGPGHSLPSALNGGQRTYTGEGKYRDRGNDSDDD